MPDRLRRLEIEESPLISRRLNTDERFRINGVHPFRFIQEPRTGHKMRVCLDSLTLDDGGPDLELARQFLLDLRPEHFELFRTPGDVRALEDVPAFVLGGEADVASVDLEAFGHKRGTGVYTPRQWGDMAEALLGDRSAEPEIVAVKAAEALSAHIFVTTSSALLRIRDLHSFKVGVVAPLETMPILSSWCRGFGDYWDGHIVTDAWHYYWALARALTPKANAGFAALVRMEYKRSDGAELEQLGQSALSRLASALRALDAMYRAWQLPTDNSTNDTISDCFDQIVLGVAGILDNLALLAGKYFGVSGLQQFEWSLERRRFLSKLRAVQDTRATELADYLDANRLRITLHTELRHHAIHRARLAGMTYRQGRQPEETRMRILEPMLGELWRSLVSLGEDPAEWGITDRQGPHDINVSFVDQPGRVEVARSPGEAFLDPMLFARLLLSKSAKTTDDIFGRLSFQNDQSLTGDDIAAVNSYDATASWPLRPSDRVALILTSPLAGL